MNNLYLISGDDEYSKSKALDNIKSQFNKLEKGINYLQFDKENMSSLGAELTTYSFFTEPKLIIVKVPKASKSEDSEPKQKSSWFDDLEDKIKNKIDDITLVFIEEGTSKGKFFKFIQENGKVYNFEKKKPNDLVNFTIQYAKEKGLVISMQDANYLAQLSGGNTSSITSSIDILQDYVENGKILKEDIDKMCIKTPEIIIFDLTDSLGTKNIKKALEYLDDLLNNKEPIQKILVMLTRHFKNLLLTKECVEKGLNVEKQLAITSYPANKYKGQAKNFTKVELVDIFEELCKLDYSSKNTMIDFKVALQRIIMMA